MPPGQATNSFSVVVNEVNVAPVLPIQTDRSLVGQQTLAVTNTATDADIPINNLAYQLISAPSGAAHRGETLEDLETVDVRHVQVQEQAVG